MTRWSWDDETPDALLLTCYLHDCIRAGIHKMLVRLANRENLIRVFSVC